MIFDNIKGVKKAKNRFLAKMAIFLTFHHRGKSDTFGPTAPNFHRIFKIPQRGENIGKSNGGLPTFFLDLRPLNGVKMAKGRFHFCQNRHFCHFGGQKPSFRPYSPNEKLFFPQKLWVDTFLPQ